MNKLVPLAVLSLALISPAALAQRMGSANDNAPEIEQAIDLGPGGRLELSYTAITWASGRWAKALEDEGARDRMRQRINGSAKQQPLGVFTAGADLVVGGVAVAEGDYKMGFTLDDEFHWQISLFGAESTIVIPLKLADAAAPEKRLSLCVHAGEKDFTARIDVAFGSQIGHVAVEVASEDEDG